MALMLMGLSLPDGFYSGAHQLCFNGQVRLNKNVDGLAVSGQKLSVADKDKQITQVLGKPASESKDCYVVNFKLEQEAISPKATVCTVLPGQYLPCGIGSSEFHHGLFNLTAVDIRRWDLCASAISEIFETTPPRNEYNAADTVKVEHLDKFLEERKLDETFAIHISNFRMENIERDWDEHIGVRASLLRDTGHLLLYLLRFFIPLTAAYGGIHLSAWNFEFPSRVESIFWRTACFIIIGSSLPLLAVPSWEKLDFNLDVFYARLRNRTWVLRFIIALRTAHYDFPGLILLCYAASRIYLVVESFISLRHVPIGVYAAVPWVENIPHV